MSDDNRKDRFSYESVDTDYLQGEEESADTLPLQEMKPAQNERETGQGAFRLEKDAGLGAEKPEENRMPRPEASPKRRGVMLPKEISLEDFYVPAGTYSRNKGGQAQIYDCYVRGEPIPAGETEYVAKLYRAPRHRGEEAVLEKVRQINRTLIGLDHPNLPKLYAEGMSGDGGYVVVMKRYDAYSGFLEYERFAGNQRAYEQIFREEVEGLNSALQLLHGRKIYHADIKPANIMQYDDPYGGSHLVLIDFGIGVQGRETNVAVTALGKTDTYMAPELYNVTKRRVGEHTDYYSLGMTMAEFVAGRYPMRNNMQERKADREYVERNRNSANQFYGLLLPEMFPDYLARFFEGTLYANTDLPIEEVYQRRWGGAQVDGWLSAVRTRDYRRARALPTGRSIAEEESRNKDAGIRVKYDSDEQAIAIYSTEEMAEMFLSHWDETIEKMLRNAKWSRIFSKFGEDVSEIVEQTRQGMQANMADRERIFDQTLMETYLPARIKNNALRYRNIYYLSEREFGESIYGMLQSEKKKTNSCYRLPNRSGEEKPDLFGRMAEMFTTGTVEKFFKAHQSNWRLGEAEMKLERQIREGFERKDKTAFVENLYRLSFRLQGEACLRVEGMKGTFQRNKQFLEEYRKLYEKDDAKAVALSEQCFNGQDRLRIDYYVFLQEAPDVTVRPEESMREKL